MKKLIVFLFLEIIFLPMLLSGIELNSEQKIDVELLGYFDEVATPEVGFEKIKTGEFQSSFTNWFDNTFSPRGVLIKTYNSIRYTCFNIGNRTIGKNKDVFEPIYIKAELCIGDEYNYSLLERRAELESYVDELMQVDEKLRNVGKKLYVYITPSKADFHRDNIPYSYAVLDAGEKTRAVDYFCELMDASGLSYLNSKDMEDELEYPAFYTSGIHWSRTYEQLVTRKVVSELSVLMGKHYRNVLLGDIEVSEDAFYRDTDVFQLLNVWNSDEVDKFYRYKSGLELPEAFDKMRILLQGGSFALGLRQDILEWYPDTELNYVNYNTYLYDNDGGFYWLNGSYDQLNLTECLNETDCVVIELNESVINKYSNGFVSYLNKVLDSYVAETPQINSIEKITFTEEVPWNANALVGYYGREDGLIWSTKYSVATIKDEQIAENGLAINLLVPYQVFEKHSEDRVTIYVNGQKMYDNIFSTPGEGVICFTPEQLRQIVAHDGIYEIHIITSASFIPKEMDLSADNRDLALQIKYMGVAE